VERWDHHTKTRRDLWGFVDMIICEGRVTIAAQVTGSNIWARHEKILFDPKVRPRALKWVEQSDLDHDGFVICTRTIEIWGWKRLKRKTKKGAKLPYKFVVQLERREVTLDDFTKTEEEFHARIAATDADTATDPTGDEPADVGDRPAGVRQPDERGATPHVEPHPGPARR
jgi:hypothetical protein